MQNNEALVVPFFKTMAVEDPIASKDQGRPIFNDVEVVEIRIAGDRNYAPVFPAHSMWQRVDGTPMTYADRWPDAYARFKAGQEQVAAGTPLSELPFLSEAKRAELRALKVYTAEALASLDGKNLKALGDMGREMKNQAEAYLSNATQGSVAAKLAAENEALRAELEMLQGEVQRGDADLNAEREALKVQIATLTGQRPRGNPSIETLRDMLADLQVTA